MSEHFDPLHRWLGIRPEEQPPDHYRLLGIAQFEDDMEVIRDAAERQIAHVRTYGLGQHSDLSQTILNQLSAAKACLLNPTTKENYDRELRQEMETHQTEESAVNPTLSVPGPEPDASPAPQALQVNPLDVRAQGSGRRVPRTRTTKRHRDTPWKAAASLIPIVFGAVGGICVAIVLLWVVWKKDPLGVINSEDTSQRSEETSEPDRRVAEVDQSATRREPLEGNENSTETESRKQGADNRPSLSPQDEPPSWTPSDPLRTERPAVTTPLTEKRAADQERDEAAEEGPLSGKSPAKKRPKNGPGVTDGHPPSLARPSDAGEGKRHPVPQGEERQAAVSQVRNIFQREYAAATDDEHRIELARILQEQAKTVDDSTARFAFLHEGYLQAVAAGDLSVGVELAEQLVAEFELDDFAVRCDLVETIAESARSTEERVGVCTEALSLAERLSNAKLHEDAVRIAKLAYSLAARARDSELRGRAKRISDAMGEKHRQWAIAQKAKAVLAESPNDAEANLACGRYLCLVEQDWDNGLAMLARSSDERLRGLAEEDLALPEEAERRIALADCWSEVAGSDDFLEGFNHRAYFWYEMSLAEAADLQKLKIEKRLQELAEYGTAKQLGAGMNDDLEVSGRHLESPAVPDAHSKVAAATASPTQILTSNRWTWSVPKNLGAPINTKGWETGPSLSPDGLTLLFVSDRPGGCGSRDLWMSERESTELPWGKPENLGSSINSPGEERTGLLLDDATTLFFSSDRSDGEGSYDIWTSSRKSRSDPWGKLSNLGPIVNTESSEIVTSLTPDGLTMFFNSGRPKGGVGGGDIWMSRRPNRVGAWGEAENLGPTVNTDSLDDGGWITSDGLTLIFGARAPGSPKEHLLWMATRPKIDQPFGQRTILSQELDSPKTEGSPTLSADGRELFFHSNRPGGRGGWDLWTSQRIQRP